MKNNKGEVSLPIVIIFGLLGFGIISAGISDIIHFGTTEDIIAIPVGLIFALPPLIMYAEQKRSERSQMTDKEKEISRNKGFYLIFLIVHICVLFLIIGKKEPFTSSLLIPVFYCIGMIIFSVYGIFNAKKYADKSYKITTYNFKTHEKHTTSIFDENGYYKPTDQIFNELHEDKKESPIKKDDNTILSYRAWEDDDK